MTVKKKCITVTEEQDRKIKAIQIRRMSSTQETVSYSSVIQEIINVGLETIQ